MAQVRNVHHVVARRGCLRGKDAGHDEVVGAGATMSCKPDARGFAPAFLESLEQRRPGPQQESPTFEGTQYAL